MLPEGDKLLIQQQTPAAADKGIRLVKISGVRVRVCRFWESRLMLLHVGAYQLKLLLQATRLFELQLNSSRLFKLLYRSLHYIHKDYSSCNRVVQALVIKALIKIKINVTPLISEGHKVSNMVAQTPSKRRGRQKQTCINSCLQDWIRLPIVIRMIQLPLC